MKQKHSKININLLSVNYYTYLKNKKNFVFHADPNYVIAYRIKLHQQTRIDNIAANNRMPQYLARQLKFHPAKNELTASNVSVSLCIVRLSFSNSAKGSHAFSVNKHYMAVSHRATHLTQ